MTNTATVNAISLSQDRIANLLPICCSFVPGNGDLDIQADLTSSPRTAVSQSMEILADRHIPMEQFGDLDIHIVFETGCVIHGESYSLALGLSILCAALSIHVPSSFAVTGVLGPAGEVIPVEGIKEKRKGVVRLGVRDIMLPEPQIDPQNSQINQWPVRSLNEALSAIESMHL